VGKPPKGATPDDIERAGSDMQRAAFEFGVRLETPISELPPIGQLIPGEG